MSLHNVRDHGAAGDGAQLDTKAIQTAIDAAASTGGTVLFPAGRYRSGTIVLRSGITLKLAAGATLVGSRELADYPAELAPFRDAVGVDRGRTLVLAHKVTDIAIEGPGTIDGQGAGWGDPRPMILRLIDCTRVRVTDLTLRDSAAWVQHYLGCEDLYLRGVKVDSRVNGNNDGLNLDGCQRVRVSDCHFSSGDDALTLKCTTARACRDITITNCLLSSHCNALKFGTESQAGGFENIVISNIAVYDTRLCGITVATVDGAPVRDVVIAGVSMRNVGAAIFVRLGARGYHLPKEVQPRPVGCLQTLILRDIHARTTDRIGSAILGLPGRPIENVLLDGLTIESPGNATAAEAARIPEELPAMYPQFTEWGGPFPAYGLFCRHVRGLTIANAGFTLLKPDPRPAIACQDVQGLVTGNLTGSVHGAGLQKNLGD